MRRLGLVANGDEGMLIETGQAVRGTRGAGQND